MREFGVSWQEVMAMPDRVLQRHFEFMNIEAKVAKVKAQNGNK